MKFHYLQHVPFEGLGRIESWIQSKGYVVSATGLYQQEPLPHSLDWLIVLGRPMNIYEDAQYPWLVQEKRLIEQAIQHNKVVVGICLGAQLIADVLGAKVFQNPHKEMGWFPITLTPEIQSHAFFQGLPRQQTVFHWHGDTFDLPSGTVRIAQSQACANQGFLQGSTVLALQFHLESTPESIQSLIHHCAPELVKGSYIQSPSEMLSQPQSFPQLHQTLFHLFDKLFQVDSVP